MFAVPSPLSNCHLTPSWNFPCYTSLLALRPLPVIGRDLHPEAEESEDEEGLDELEDQFATELDEEEEDSFIDTQEETQRTGSNKRSTKKRKKDRRGSGTNEDIDLEPSRHPLSQKFHENRKQQRIDHHPNSMPPKKKTGSAPSRKSARVSAADGANRAQDVKDKENQELKEKVAALEAQLKVEREAFQSGKSTTNDTAMGREVAKIAKKLLWKRCKFIKCDKTLRKGTK